MAGHRAGNDAKRLTIRDVARSAKVSPATVSRVLNGYGVDPELTSRVKEAVLELGYRPSRIARSLRNRTTMVWGLIIGDIRNSFFTQMARGVEDVAAELGYSVVLCNTDEDLSKETSYIDLVLDDRMAGCIITPAHTQETQISRLVDAAVPVVAVDRAPGDNTTVDIVRLNNWTAAASATRHLLQQGFSRVGCITGPETTTTGRERALGYLDVVTGADLLRWADFKTAGGYGAAQSLLTLAEPPDAIVVGNNLMMTGTLHAIKDLGLSPYDTGLIGFDEVDWAEFARPSLSTIGQPTYEMGQAAAKQLVARIEGDDSPPKEIVMEPLLTARESSVRRQFGDHP